MNIILPVPNDFVNKFYERIGEDKRNNINDVLATKLYKEFASSALQGKDGLWDNFFDFIESIAKKDKI